MSTYDLPRHMRHPPRAGLAGRVARTLRRRGLARELTVILAVKFVILLIFKYTLFSHPQAPHMELPPTEVAQAILSVPVSLPPPASGDHHDK